MRAIHRLGAVLVAVGAMIAGPAQAFYAMNGFRIEATGADQMVVYPLSLIHI